MDKYVQAYEKLMAYRNKQPKDPGDYDRMIRLVHYLEEVEKELEEYELERCSKRGRKRKR